MPADAEKGNKKKKEEKKETAGRQAKTRQGS
jgi:hypothetical protein